MGRGAKLGANDAFEPIHVSDTVANNTPTTVNVRVEK